MVLMYRQAGPPDIRQMKEVRSSVLENRLSDPSRISDEEYDNYISVKGKGWICLHDETIAGFSVGDLEGKNVWALFVRPEYEGHGIGRRLQELMLDWYFSETQDKIWLSTEPGSRAEAFYRTSGWIPAGKHGEKEVRFELTFRDWQEAKRVKNLYA
jgi:GNAT superfamily N-acetyltransferase